MSTTGVQPRPTLEGTLLAVAKALSRRGTCPRRQVGAVIADEHGRVMSTGYNGAPPGQQHCTDHPCPGAFQKPGEGLSLCEAVHAEANALLHCHDVMKARTIFCTVSPCNDCVKLLLVSGIQTIYFIEEYPHEHARDRWVRAGRRWIMYVGG